MIAPLTLRLHSQLERLAGRLLGKGREAFLKLVGVTLVVLALLPLAQLALEVGQGSLDVFFGHGSEGLGCGESHKLLLSRLYCCGL